jgi:hypothetical protein
MHQIEALGEQLVFTYSIGGSPPRAGHGPANKNEQEQWQTRNTAGRSRFHQSKLCPPHHVERIRLAGTW